jgi:formylmethanofuran dehydrogenase subunit D
MVQNQGLDVYLAPFDDNASRYQQYTASAASPDFTGDPNEVYIEAVDGERFIIMVDVMESFDT